MKKFLSFLIFFFFASKIFAAFTLEGQIKHLRSKKLYLFSYRGAKTSIFDSILIQKNGKFSFIFPDSTKNGIFQLRFSQTKFIDIIFNSENIKLSSHFDFLKDSMKILESQENQLFFEYLQSPNRYEKGLEITTLYPNLFVSKLINAIRIPLQLLENQRDSTEFKKQFFNNIDFNDSRLMRCPALTYKIRLFFNDILKHSQNVEIQRYTNLLMSKAAQNTEMLRFISEQIFDVFEKNEQDELMEWFIFTHSYSGNCANSDISRNVEKIKNLKTGNIFPHFSVQTVDNQAFNFEKIESKYFLIFFWQSNCSHCLEVLPSVKKFFERNKNLEIKIIAISLDKDKKELLQTIENQGIKEFYNVSDFLGENSPLLETFHIIFTPKFFLLDKEKKILLKTSSFEEVEKKISTF